ncbi:murein transglycosylase A [Amorphus coralli]|uniref:murein transglycosylase A n=1 Tax=Amorphus coralli TaxID=340680 RepID=UPI00035C44C1|nr:MltA domain-containing protein [Amorphus coralli]
MLRQRVVRRAALAVAIMAAGTLPATSMSDATLSFTDLSGWADAPVAASLSVFRRHCERLASRAPEFRRVCEAQAALPDDLDDGAARAFFETWFRPERIGAPGSGFLTGYFEPELAASHTRSDAYPVPVLARPDDLVAIDAASRPEHLPDGMAFARQTPEGLKPYADRAAIEAGALDGRGLEIAWLADPVDAFFMHVQGSARLRFDDGSTLRVNFAAKSGHPYTAIGRIVVEEGHVARENLDYETLRAWLKANPDEARRIMAQNRSYIFFRPVEGLSEDDGPVGAAGVPLTPEVSLAIDRAHHEFGVPLWIDARLPIGEAGAEEPFRRLMVGEDRGSAIVGEARGDVFLGSGDAAGDRAGRIQHTATLYRLVPVELDGSGDR